MVICVLLDSINQYTTNVLALYLELAIWEQNMKVHELVILVHSFKEGELTLYYLTESGEVVGYSTNQLQDQTPGSIYASYGTLSLSDQTVDKNYLTMANRS